MKRNRTWRLLTIASLLAVPALGEKVETLRLPDRAEMAYVARGAGEPALVFVHCGNCRMEIWDETLAGFEAERRVVAMDLPGYGRSTVGERESFTIPQLGADVAALVEHLGLRRLILIGNSLGGPVALEAARRLGPERVLGVVAVDTLQNVEREWPEENWRRILDAYRADFPGTCRGFMLGLLPEDSSDAVRERIDRDTCGGDPPAAIALHETLRDYDTAAALRAAAVPVRAINSSRYPTATEINRKHALAFDVVLMEGVGHYPQVERPEEFQRHLRAAVRGLVESR